YLNPIFESHSNHRYDTADYSRIDPLLGNEEDLKRLCSRAKEYGIRILLDGVFSHTGSDSVYFNREGRYPAPGAYQSQQSPYFSWYQFQHWPERYSSWWGFETLPEVHETSPAFLDYLLGKDGIVRKWLRCGVSGWRLDVADELPDQFLEALRRCVKEESADHLILGEVWEDASNKESYGHRRAFLLGSQLDSVMNYPFRAAVLDFLRGGTAQAFLEAVLTVVENYPPQVLPLLMNHIGTHDTERALTMLGGEPLNGRDREWQAHRTLSGQERERGLALLRLAALLQYTLPGVPCVYYGDEAGMEGYRDPFNRGCYLWGQEDSSLVEWYRVLGCVRRCQAVLKNGAFLPVEGHDGTLCFARQDENGVLLTAVNRTDSPSVLNLPEQYRQLTFLAGEASLEGGALTLPPLSGVILGTNAQA
ncbi:MAG: glycoside hydrolase family 13 protein, partial [Clostridiales bacterium]|nr:glycoside hydrolase family 13 protein [Clostridiales bacterium]